jgi:hypothetical protein
VVAAALAPMPRALRAEPVSSSSAAIPEVPSCRPPSRSSRSI